ncbi:MAG TPA: hypothetical protein VHB27_13530 [Rhodopila sp.]|uniref:hypothetical protein n=1 Tax=Rhodopila sp. TaxID=2480087 RepID=UPI002D06406A|nr:hypothetical protein [Rhodopila sp.]HVY16240.1 hypothetical protein [Rhodopila sp.]
MTTLTWTGGGNNRASNPDDWSPNQAPAPGDTLLMQGQGTPYAIDIRGDDLAGNPLTLLFAEVTANLSHRAVASLNGTGASGTFNLSHRSTLTSEVSQGEGVYNLSGRSTLNLGGAESASTINISGRATAILGANQSGYRSSYTVNLDQYAKWSGTFDAFGAISGQVVVNGAEGSRFDNNGASSVDYARATIGADVVGAGSFNIVSSPSSRIEFMKSVGRNQSISDGGFVQVDRPDLFRATVTLDAAQSGLPAPEIDLMNLAAADSYTFKNDMLKIFSGDQVIDKLHLHDSTQHGFVVEAPTAGGAVKIVAITDPTHAPAGLPLHGMV